MATQNQDRLRMHFATLDASTVSQSSGWDSLWEEAKFLPWDRGLPNPALIDLLAHPSSPPTSSTPNPTPGAPAPDSTPGAIELPSPVESGKRKKVLVPGCGKGYDVKLFAAYEYDAVGLEVSPHAAKAATDFFAAAGEGVEGEYKSKVGEQEEGSAVCVVGDFFEDEWVKDAGLDVQQGEGFDVIYDNTFLCALPPSLRPRWAARVSQLLAKDGVLICLEFPTHKPASSAGPPWSLPPTVHVELLKQPGKEITYNEEGVVVGTERANGEGALVRVAHWTPARSHDVGVVKGVVRDCVSVWRHASAPTHGV